jgi:hypothetical protein
MKAKVQQMKILKYPTQRDPNYSHGYYPLFLDSIATIFFRILRSEKTTSLPERPTILYTWPC